MLSFVIGNGESRRGFDLELLRAHGIVVGCNAIYRDFKPDILVSVDKEMTKEINNNHYNGRFFFRVREGKAGRFIKEECRRKVGKFIEEKGGKSFRDRGWSCGQTAIKLVCDLYKEIDTVFLLGFDIYGNKDKKINNMYKGTKNYSHSNVKEVYYLNWIRQIGDIAEEYDRVMFYRVGNMEDKFPEQWKRFDNIKFISYASMCRSLNLDWALTQLTT